MESFRTKFLRAVRNNETITQAIANKISAVLLLEYCGVSILLGADAPSEIWRQILGAVNSAGIQASLKSKVFRVSHHGSKESYLDRLLIEIDAGPEKFAIISAGSAKHPTSDTLASLRKSSRVVYKTGLGQFMAKRSVSGIPPEVSTALNEISISSDDLMTIAVEI